MNVWIMHTVLFNQCLCVVGFLFFIFPLVDSVKTQTPHQYSSLIKNNS